MANNTNNTMNISVPLEAFKTDVNNTYSNKYKKIASWTLFYCAFTYGLTTYIIGPALNDMTIKLNTTTDNITLVLGCLLAGYTLGAIIIGIIFNFINRQLVLICLLVIMAGAVSLAPNVPKLWMLLVDGLVCGFGAGGFDTAQVVWLIELWGDKSSQYLQGMQFFNALGTVISPLMTAPYLATKIEQKNKTQSITAYNITSYLTSNSSHSLHIHNNNDETKDVDIYTKSQIEIPFGIVGALLLTSALLLLILHFYRRYTPPVDENDQFVCKCPERLTLIYIILGVFTIAPYVGMEVMNFQLIATFAKYSHLQLSGSDAALVQTVMAAAFALFRGISIGNVVTILFEVNGYSHTVLFIGVIVTGIGFSTVFASVYAFLEKHIAISNAVGGLLVCTCGLMGGLLPT
ncbi:unnamed protein product, partial [Medioppia subpectinata]